MRTFGKISLFLCYSFFLLCSGAFLGKYAETFFYPGTYQEGRFSVGSEKEELQASSRRQTTTCDTVFMIKNCYEDGSVKEAIEEALPEQYIGMDREAFIAAMEVFKTMPGLKEKQKGFLSLEIESFSPEKIVVKKYYKVKNSYLAAKDHQVIVLSEDKSTCTMETGIYLKNIPEELAEKIIHLMPLKNEEELNNFLVSYSS